MKTIYIIIIIVASILVIAGIITAVVVIESNQTNSETFQVYASSETDLEEGQAGNSSSGYNSIANESPTPSFNKAAFLADLYSSINQESICENRSDICCTGTVNEELMASMVSCKTPSTKSMCTGSDDYWCPGPTVIYSEFAECDTLYVNNISWGGAYIGTDLTDSTAIVYDTLYNDEFIDEEGEEEEEIFEGYRVLVCVSNNGYRTMGKCVLIDYYIDNTWEQVPGSAKYFISNSNALSLSNEKIKSNYNSSTHSIPDYKYQIKSITLSCYEGTE